MCSLLQRAEIDAALGSESGSSAFATIEERLNGLPPADHLDIRARIIEALHAAFKGGKPLTVNWLRAICEAGPNYLRPSDGAGGRLTAPSNEDRLCALLMDAFAPLAPSERGALVGSIIPDLADLSLLCALFRRVEGDWAAEGATRGATDSYFGPRAVELQNELIDRVVSLARSHQIWRQASAASILWYWFACGQEQEVYVFVKQSMRDASSLASVLEALLEQNDTGEGGHGVVAVRRWSKIIDFNTLEKRALELLLSGASRADKARARRFLDAYASGKSDLFK